MAAGLCRGRTLPTDAQMAAIIAAIRPPHIWWPAALAERLTAQRAQVEAGWPRGCGGRISGASGSSARRSWVSKTSRGDLAGGAVRAGARQIPTPDRRARLHVGEVEEVFPAEEVRRT